MESGKLTGNSASARSFFDSTRNFSEFPSFREFPFLRAALGKITERARSPAAGSAEEQFVPSEGEMNFRDLKFFRSNKARRAYQRGTPPRG